MEAMKLLSLDPSSTMTGYAIMDEKANLVEAGLIKPRKAGDELWTRILTMSKSLITLIKEIEPTHCIVEVPIGKHRRLPAAMSGSLVKYGCAVGSLYLAAHLFCPHVYPVSTLWTGGKAKVRRAGAVAFRFPTYDPDKDKGLDMADAIGMGVWWLDQQAGRYAKRMLRKP